MRIISILFFFLGIVQSLHAQETRDSVTVYYFMSEECKICQYYSLTQQELYDAYNDDYTSFVGLFPNGFSSPSSIEEYQKKYNIPFILKKEFFQTKTKKFGATITPEVVVYNESKEEIIYKGRISNAYASLGKRRRVITQQELKTVLEDLKNNVTPTVQNTEPIGCFIMLKK